MQHRSVDYVRHRDVFTHIGLHAVLFCCAVVMAENGVGGGPRDAAVMEAILREMGVEDFEPNLIHQMLEFSYSQ